MLLQNKIAVVTGGGSGSGHAAALAFATRSVFRGDYMRSSYAC